jgi:hypothetical protein
MAKSGNGNLKKKINNKLIVVYLTSSPRGPLKRSFHSRFKLAHSCQFTQERLEYNVFLFDEPLKGSRSLNIFKVSLTFSFDELSHLSKSVHTGEN